MKYFSLSLLLITLLTSATLAQAQTPPNNSDAPQAITQMENSFNEAMLKGDAAALEKLLAAEWFVNLDSTLITKLQYIDWLKSNGGPYTSIKDSDVNVTVHDNVIVVTGVSTREPKSGQATMNLRFTRIYAKSPAGWQFVAMHFARIIQK
jgi:ketosteroid isomerase-like protein